MSDMKAVIFEGKEEMRIAVLPRPSCGEDEVLLEIAACGVCGGDVRSFFIGDKFTGQSRIPGHEAVGIVAEAGRNVRGFHAGDRLALAADVHCGRCYYCHRELYNMCESLRILGKDVSGALTDCMLLTNDVLSNGIVNRVPEGLKTLHAALSEPLCSVLASHSDLEIRRGETVVVLGCGPMGILHLQLLRAMGARCIAVDVAASRVERARKDFGFESSIDGGREDVLERVRGLTDGIGADVVIVAAPSGDAVRQAVHLVRKRGRVGVFGGLPSSEAEVSIDLNRVHYGEIWIIGNFSYHPRYHRRALELLAAGSIPCDKLITSYALDDTRKALQDAKEGKVLKAVVLPNQGRLL